MSVEERNAGGATRPTHPNPTYTTPPSKSKKKRRSGLKALSERQKDGVKEQRSRGGGRPPKTEHVATTSESRSGNGKQQAPKTWTNSGLSKPRPPPPTPVKSIAGLFGTWWKKWWPVLSSQAEMACRQENSITPCKFTAHRRRSKSAQRSRSSRHMPVLTGTETNGFEATHQPFSCEGSPREGQELRGAPVGPACLGDLTG